MGMGFIGKLIFLEKTGIHTQTIIDVDKLICIMRKHKIFIKIIIHIQKTIDSDKLMCNNINK